MCPRRRVSLFVAASVLVGCAQLSELAVLGEDVVLRPSSDEPTPGASDTTLLVVALDGVPRGLLYDLLRSGRMPGLERLLGDREDGDFPHAYFDETTLSVLPAVTIPGWASVFSGYTPAEHGVTGNEMFLREDDRFVAPIPGSFSNAELLLRSYTDDYANELLAVPSVYEQIRPWRRGLEVWVSVSPFYRGADRLLIAQRSAAIDLLPALVSVTTAGDFLSIYEQRDQEILDTVVEELEEAEAPDVLTVYVAGTDQYAHGAEGSPERALTSLLTGELDDMLDELAERLEEVNTLDDRFVLVVSDHGHVDVVADDAHNLGTNLDADDPPALLRRLGWRIRPFEVEPETHDHQVVFAYQGAFAYVYVADRSTCAKAGTRCDWTRPPRFEEDVLPVAEAFYRAAEEGSEVAALEGTLDLVLTRRPRPHEETDEPFSVYQPGGELVPIGEFLRDNPRPRYVAFERRLADLAVGRFGERAGDVLLLARNGNETDPTARYYFNDEPFESGHGSPSRDDSEVVLILARKASSQGELEERARRVLGSSPTLADVGRLIVDLVGGPKASEREAP